MEEPLTAEETHDSTEVGSVKLLNEHYVVEAVPVLVLDPARQGDIPPVWILIVVRDVGSRGHTSTGGTAECVVSYHTSRMMSEEAVSAKSSLAFARHVRHF